MRRTLLPLLLLLGLATAGARAGTPSASLSWRAEAADPSAGSLLFVLERGPEGWVLLDARTAAVSPKTRRGADSGDGPLLALVDGAGQPLLLGRLDVPERLHGPVLDAEGEVRCVSVPLEQPTVALRLPWPAAAAELRLYEAAEHAPRSGAELADALRARATDSGLTPLASFDLRDVVEAQR